MPDNIEVTDARKCVEVRKRPTKSTPTLLPKLQHTDNCCTDTTVYHCNQHPTPFLFKIQLQNKQQQYSQTKLKSLSTSSSSSDECVTILFTITSTIAVLYINTSPALSLKEHLTSPSLLLFTSFAFMRLKKTNGFKVSSTSPTTTTTTATTDPPTGRKYKRANCTKSDAHNKSNISTSLATALTAKVNLSSTLTATTAVSAQVTTSVFLVTVAVLSPSTATTAMSPTSQIPPSSRTSLFDSCHRKIRLIGGGPVAFLGGLVAKARRKEREGDHNSTDTKLYLEESVLERKLPEADLKALVDLPAGLDYNEWLASHTLALFEHVNLVYGTISEFCTPSGCADMTGPGNRTYLWFDEKGKKTRVAAPQYIDYVMTFTQKTVSDESIFPTKYANEFPSSFESIARKILRLQFHVIAHLYAAHFREIALLGLHTHLNLTFAHLTALHRRFTLIDEKETDVLRDLEVALRLTDDSNSQSAQSENNRAGMAVATSTTTTSNESGESSNSKQIMEEVNSRVQHNNISVLSSLIFESKESVPPICTQPEATTKSQQHFNSIGLMSGILGDLSTGELSYCASPVPASSFSATSNSSPSCTSSYTVDDMTTSAPGVNNDAEAATLHFNFNHNSNNNNNNSQYHNHHLLHHVHAHQNLYTPNSGLIQCNATNAPSAVNTTSSTTA